MLLQCYSISVPSILNDGSTLNKILRRLNNVACECTMKVFIQKFVLNLFLVKILTTR